MEWIISTIVFFLIIWLIFCIYYSIENNNDAIFKRAFDRKQLLDILVVITMTITFVLFILIGCYICVWFIHLLIFEV